MSVFYIRVEMQEGYEGTEDDMACFVHLRIGHEASEVVAYSNLDDLVHDEREAA